MDLKGKELPYIEIDILNHFKKYNVPENTQLLYKREMALIQTKNLFGQNFETHYLEKIVSNFETTCENISIKNWTHFYKFFKIEQEDKYVSIFLHYVMSIYNILYHKEKQKMCTRRIFLVGVENEADLMYSFLILGHLLPETSFTLVMIGTDIDNGYLQSQYEKHRSVFDKYHLKLEFYCGLLHNVLHEPFNVNGDIAICLNSGFPAYQNWKESLDFLRRHVISTYLTEYSTESFIYTRKMLHHYNIGNVSTLSNEFKCPFEKYSNCYSNNEIGKLEFYFPARLIKELHDCQVLVEFLSKESVSNICNSYVDDTFLCGLLGHAHDVFLDNISIATFDKYIYCAKIPEMTLPLTLKFAEISEQRSAVAVAHFFEIFLDSLCDLVRYKRQDKFYWFCTEFKPQLTKKMHQYAKLVD
ncbi:hypothetical protein A3Q56_03480 [Intoshia linei]|uniref:Mitochondrial splicing suppressor 51-like C-terminal domain-containing protein n=1 Tax=Intoshia linei TaxID=1819745 RepID=A0A177B5B7_9BILA|nr:hypothetical protein A3Q56_03480 [Intoshia linei]